MDAGLVLYDNNSGLHSTPGALDPTPPVELVAAPGRHPAVSTPALKVRLRIGT